MSIISSPSLPLRNEPLPLGNLKQRRLVWEGGRNFRFSSVAAPVAEPGAGEVLLKVRAVGICATDIHIVNGILSFAPPPPFILGHEVAGEIAAVGPGVTSVTVGDRVTVDQVIGCGDCVFCKRGSAQFCSSGYELGISRDGGGQDYLILPAANVYPIPHSISFAEAAVLDMEVWKALSRCRIQPGEKVLIFGGGSAGLIACQVARINGAGRVFLCERYAPRRRFAERLGIADRVIASDKESLEELIANETNGLGADVVVDCAGSEESPHQALAAVLAGGRILLYGVYPGPLKALDLNQIVVRDLTVYGALSDRHGWQDVIDLVATGKLQLAPLITHRFPIERGPEGYALVREKGDGVIKAVLELD